MVPIKKGDKMKQYRKVRQLPGFSSTAALKPRDNPNHAVAKVSLGFEAHGTVIPQREPFKCGLSLAVTLGACAALNPFACIGGAIGIHNYC
jgi:hypothetical protein